MTRLYGNFQTIFLPSSKRGYQSQILSENNNHISNSDRLDNKGDSNISKISANSSINNNVGSSYNTRGSSELKVASQQLALSLPEILENILVFVSLHYRQRIAQLVNKQWYSICKGLVPVVVEWPLCLPENEDKVAQELVLHANHLKIRVCQKEEPEQRITSWIKNMHTLSTLQEMSQSKLKSLHFLEGVIVNVSIQLLQMPQLPSLTTIKIDRENGWSMIYLFTIFRACPGLVELVIKPVKVPRYSAQIQQSDLQQKDETELINSVRLRPMIRLRTCILYNELITSMSMKAFLEVCPQLSELILMDISCCESIGDTTVQELDRSFVINLVKSHCPMLKKFHISYQDDKLSDQDISSIIENLPDLEDYCFSNNDSGPTLLAGLSTVANRITTLNLLPSRRGYSFQSIDLRKILCTFVHLIHLRAPTLSYYFEDMDVNNVEGKVSPFTNHIRRSILETMAQDLKGKYIWACRGLQTLQIAIGSWSSNSTEPYKSLIIFGFLTRMCPRLQELYLESRMIDMSFKGGMCLLTRLHDLRRIHIISSVRKQPDEQAFLWLRLTPSIKEHLNHPRLLISIQKELWNWYRGFANHGVDKKKIIQDTKEHTIDMNNLGLIIDLQDWTSERYGSPPLASLASLEKLIVECPYASDNTMIEKQESIVRQIRPDIDFRYNHSIKDPYFITLETY